MRLAHFSPIVALLAVSISFMLGCSRACWGDPPEKTTPTATATATPLRPPFGEDQPHNDQPHNSLEPSALQAYGGVLSALTRGPLTSGEVRNALSGDLARKGVRDNPDGFNALMKYIVSCALDPGDTVNPDEGETSRVVAASSWTIWDPSWTGELGLCGRQAPVTVGNWREQAASEQCKQLVSACVLARTNKVGKKVAISLRGEPSELFAPLRSHVKVERQYRERHGTVTIQSFDPCQNEALGNPRRDCGWAADQVGRCVADTEVTVHVEGESSMLRICAGIHGCNDRPGKSDTSYSRCLSNGADCTAAVGPEISFTCPRNGPKIKNVQYGYYGVMVASSAMPTPPRTFKVTAMSGDPRGSYPATEEQVFTVREGAFYGDIFSMAPVERSLPAEAVTALYNDMFACYDYAWKEGPAYLADRLCALPTSTSDAGSAPAPLANTCFGNSPRICQSDRCTGGYGMNGAYRDCSGTGSQAQQAPWGFPITVYLNHPCDLSASCGRNPEEIEP